MSLFGQPAPNSSLFGTTVNQPSQSPFGHSAQSQSSLFGTPLSAPNPQSQPALFGAQTPTTPQQSLFGSSSNPQQSLFGSASHPQSSPSLFGTNTAQAQPSLFGGATTPQTQTSLFGGSLAQQSNPSIFGGQGAPQPQQSVFGSGSAQSNAALTVGLFGQSQPASLFASPAFSSGSGFGGFSGGSQPAGYGAQLGQPQAAFMQHAYAQQQLPEPAPGSTHISQLPGKAIEALEAVNRSLMNERAKATRIFALQSNSEENTRILRERCASARRRLVQTETCVETLTASANALRHAVQEERRSADSVSFSLSQLSRSLQSETDPYSASSNSLMPSWNVGPIPSAVTHVSPDYFARVINDLEQRASKYKHEIDQIADFLHADGSYVRASASGIEALQVRYRVKDSQTPDSLGQGVVTRHHEVDGAMKSRGRMVEEIIRRQYEYFMRVANSIAEVQETLAQLRESFVSETRRNDPDAVDPFAQANARDRAEEERRRRAVASMQNENMLSGNQHNTSNSVYAVGQGPSVVKGASPSATTGTDGFQLGGNLATSNAFMPGSTVTQSATAIMTGGLTQGGGFSSNLNALNSGSATSLTGSTFGYPTNAASQSRRASGGSTGRRSYRSR